MDRGACEAMPCMDVAGIDFGECDFVLGMRRSMASHHDSGWIGWSMGWTTALRFSKTNPLAQCATKCLPNVRCNCS